MRTENCRPLLRSGAPGFFGGKSPTRKAESDETPLSCAAIGLQRNAAFTLIEIMVVLVIIMILVGIVVGAAKYAQTKAARSRAESEIAMMETALESYKSDNGTYPPSTAVRDSGSGNAPGQIAINNSLLLY